MFLNLNPVMFLLSVNDRFSIDASTNHAHRLGRFVNDSPKRLANCAPKAMFLGGKPRLLLFATKYITVGTELRYDYGGGSLPWRMVNLFLKIVILYAGIALVSC